MKNFGRAERKSRDKYDQEAKQVVAALQNSISDKVASHEEATANDESTTKSILKEGRAPLNDRIAQNPHGRMVRWDERR